VESTAAQLVGAVLNGRWKIVKLLGEGGMGAVYEADGTRGEGKRALKLLHPEFVKEPIITQRFFAEATTAQQLHHANIARVFEHATAEDGTPYLVMELLEGIPVVRYVEDGKPMPPEQAAPIVHGVLQALTVAHTARIVHRDLKPDNLFLVRDARGSWIVKVLDFGIAKVMDAAGGMGQKTKTGVLLGTPGYMSPEQIKNAKAVDPRSDLWSAGVLFYELLTARQPFHADNEFARMTAVLTQPMRPIGSVLPHLAGWQPFFDRALAKDLSARFQTAEEMAAALLAVARGGAMPTPGAPLSTVQPMSIATPQPAPAAPVTTATPPPAATVVQALPSAGPPLQPPPAAGAGRSGGTLASEPWSAASPSVGGTSPSAPLVPLPGAAPGYSHHPPPVVQVVDAPPLRKGAPYWVVALVGVVALVVGVLLGHFVGR
jgi:serine/threonine-protein kinase